MVMRRAELLYLADMTATSFNSLAVRALLPFPPSRSGNGWASYHDADALRLSLLRALTQAGQPQSRAARLVRGHFEDLVEYAECATSPSTTPFLFGAAVLKGRSVEADADPEILAIVTETGRIDRSLEAELSAQKRETADVEELCLVNVTACMEAVLGRASSMTGQMVKLGRLMRARR